MPRLVGRWLISGTARALAQTSAVSCLIAGMLVLLVSLAASADAPIDVRGDWDVVAVARGTSYPQAFHIMREDFVTGAISGSDTGP